MVGFWEGLWRIVGAWLERHPRTHNVLLLVVRTMRAFARDRVVGLAAESAFFSLISLPALLLCLVGALGPLATVLGEDLVEEIRLWILDLAARVLTPDTVGTVVEPLVDDFLGGVQGGLLSVTFLVSLWSGSRAMNVFIRSITISYGLDELRGWLRQRVLAFVGYLGALLFALLVLPILVAGPDLVHRMLPVTVGRLNVFYWPIVVFLALAAVTFLYALSVPVRTPLWRHLPGALLATLVLIAGSVALRAYLDASFGQVSIYGSLAAPIAILAWLYVMAIAVLAGSSLNSEIDAMWPTARTAAARAEIATLGFERANRLVERREQAVIDTIEGYDRR
ncbi:membrane protein [Nocardiopsis sp. Huas11]|uniref:YihY/virulence factor BrkB family protein n=1 Tax=Nocardiopsis sp. Huas11 TaxID=2183912 RepID=UPI000EB2CE92|nr:YihY/virulence factor BrkB family protein [Nocardiopsis sp. Huas11]RKS07947.1 membrane protein [Nocardiopsis sp. Huas11]